MISVICPTYNSEKFIDRTIKCLLEQSVSPDEIIFSDDGSMDKTIDKILANKSSFEKKNINFILIKNQHNGPGYTRNVGITKAKNLWISFLDSDDLWRPDKVEKVIKEIKLCKSANTILHLESFIKLNGNKEILDYTIYYDKHKPLSEQLYKTNFFSTSAISIKKELLSEYNGFDSTLPNAQDYDLWLKMAPKIKLRIIPEVLGEYYEEESSITRRPYNKKIIAIIKIWYRYRNYTSKKEALVKLIKILFNKSWLSILK